MFAFLSDDCIIIIYTLYFGDKLYTSLNVHTHVILYQLARPYHSFHSLLEYLVYHPVGNTFLIVTFLLLLYILQAVY